MIDPLKFYNSVIENNIEFFTGVPDSLLKEFCFCVTENTHTNNHIINTNEGSSVGLAIGYNMATGKIPLVYLQNSGLGNIINPYTSLSHSSVFDIPILFFIGWRGEPGQIDEPQHLFQGKITEDLLKLLEIDYEILKDETSGAIAQITKIIKKINSQKTSIALLIKKNTFSKYNFKAKKNNNLLEREKCINLIFSKITKNDIVISTTGKTSREVYESISKNGYLFPSFYTIGGMGHCNQIALGVSKNSSSRVFCLDGDGSSLMHLGSLGILGMNANKNLFHIIFNNASHESVGGQPTIAEDLNFEELSNSLGYKRYILLDDEQSFNKWIGNLEMLKDGPLLVEVKVKNLSRKNLGRPVEPPIKQKESFINRLNDINQ